MAGIGSILTGENGKTYQLVAELGSGGEGVVYRTDKPDMAVKIYKKLTPETERKVRYMVSCPVDSYAKDAAHTPIIAWPQDTLFEEGRFVGYAMPLAVDTLPIYTLCRGEPEAKAFFKNYSWLTHLGVAFNLANTVKYLHSIDCVVGDMNSKNIVVHRNGLITFLDADSFDLTNSVTGEHFPCTVGRPEFLPPELQGRNLVNARFTKYSDQFSLAVHLFRLLLHNRHPFDVKVLNVSGESRNESKQDYNISMGNCAYVRTVPGCEVPPNEPTLDMLPDDLKEDFRRTFNYDASNVMDRIDQRTTAEKWAADLGNLYKNRQTMLEQCQQNPEHYFLRAKGICEFCRVSKPSVPYRYSGSPSRVQDSGPEQHKSAPIINAPQPSAPVPKVQQKKKMRRFIFCLATACLWIVSLVAVYTTMNKEISRLDRVNSNLWTENRKLEEKADFLDSYIRIVVPEGEGSEYYHRWGCSEMADGGFLAFNLNAAKSKYIPCPVCCGDD